MAVGWARAFDQSKARVPISRMQEAYDAGYRVAGFYAGGGSPDKWPARGEVDAWLSRPGTGVAGLFEIYGTEPIDFPSRGAVHARAARSAWRAYGYPDDAAIFVAVDENVSLAQARDQLTAYFGHWASADTCKPVAYVEADAGAILMAEGLTAGTFTPAAWGWDVPATLYTPANAPGHVLWTQEHNGRALYGGDLDIGHIRTTAPIWWRDGRVGDVGVVGMDEQSIAAAVWAYRVDDKGAPPPAGQPVSAAAAVRASYFRDGQVANVDDPALKAALVALAAEVAALPGAQPGAGLTHDEIVSAMLDAYASGRVALAVVPAAPAG